MWRASFSLIFFQLALVAAWRPSAAEYGLQTIEMVSAIFRHGDRAPDYLYPNDPHKDYKWPGGLGAVSQKGILGMYNLGKSLKMRYNRLLPADGLYSNHDMHVRSSTMERCIVSAESLLAGFMPPDDSLSILPIKWQPIPVYTEPRDRDNIILQMTRNPIYDALLRDLFRNPPPDIKFLNEINADLYKYLANCTGKSINHIGDVSYIYNTLYMEKNAGLELPAWTNNCFPDRMIPSVERNFVLITETPLMKKIKAGPILAEIYQNMVKKRDGILKPNRNIFLYSGHDTTLVNIMHSLDILDQTTRRPDFGATFVIELHRNSMFEDDFEVKIVYYTNSGDIYPKNINIPNCSAPCSLSNFGASIKHLIN